MDSSECRETPERIEFYRARHEYGCFSNFSLHPVVIDGMEWPTSEHYYQAQKFASTIYEKQILCAPTPLAAARMGGQRDWPLRPDWNRIKNDVMREVVLAKFQQHPDIRDVLLSTGDAILVEHTKYDSYWGDGGDGSGKNMLGTILMEVRAQLMEGDKVT